MSEVDEYVWMFDDGSLYVCGALEALFISEAGFKLECLGFL